MINDWRLGFRGAVILHGMRFAGKSLFGDMITHRYFKNDTIVLNPNAMLNLLGRRVQLTYNLEEALDFVSKYSNTKNKLIWIDDLELWGNGETSIQKNVEALMNHIDRFDQRFFYMVSMNSWTLSHFNEMFGLNQGIEASINLQPHASIGST